MIRERLAVLTRDTEGQARSNVLSLLFSQIEYSLVFKSIASPPHYFSPFWSPGARPSRTKLLGGQGEAILF